ncbi:MAG: hypothetical protein HY591_01475 [Candidatus Omnitrophica bacterium]|nr:hypothetical protein [Candidatus Omnitrophota bacterium]
MMTAHILVDDWLYMDFNGETGAYSREEVQRDFKHKIKTVTAAFIDCDVRMVRGPGSGTVFPNEYVVQEERLSADSVQVIAAKKEFIEEIYAYFKPVNIAALVPYAAGIRAFLKSRSMVPTDRIVLFVDDLKTQALVTVLEGPRFTAPRRLGARDLEYMGAEIKRSRHNYLAQRGGQEEPSFMIVSNNRQWLSSFIAQGLVTQDNAAYVDAAFPVLEGLKAAKFGMHFVPPGELEQRKRKSMARQRLKMALIGILSIAVGSGLYGASVVRSNNAAARLRQTQLEQQKNDHELSALYQRKFRRWLFQYKDLPYGRLYYDFIDSAPADHGIKEFTISQISLDHWQVNAWIYPIDDDVPYVDFSKQGLFSAARITPSVIYKRLGQKIGLSINPNSQIRDVHALEDDPIKGLNDYYRSIYDHLRVLGGFNGFKRSVEVTGISESGAIESAAKPSQWPGINQLGLKINFYELTGADQCVRILQSLGNLRQSYPLNVTSVKQSGNNLEILIELYGK